VNRINKLDWIIPIVVVIVSLLLLNYPAFDLTFGVFSSGDYSLLLPSILGSAINLTLFYSITFYVVPVILKKKGVPLFLFSILTLLVVLSLIEAAFDASIYHHQGGDLTNAWGEIISMIFIFNIFIIIISLTFRFTKDWFYNEKQRAMINEWQLRTELELLKSQIDPHFLFNALNNLFSMSLQHGDEKTAEGISKLSEMMRYVFDKSSQETVPLNQEVQYIQDYIYLQELRFGKQINVNFEVKNDKTGISIAPMLLIPFIENAFKYGVSAQEKTRIDLSIDTNGTVFNFTIVNNIMEDNEANSSNGIGLENVRKRLELLYPKKYDLDIVQQNGLYQVDLKLYIL
jgi:two-component system LytT family sensor kinase